MTHPSERRTSRGRKRGRMWGNGRRSSTSRRRLAKRKRGGNADAARDDNNLKKEKDEMDLVESDKEAEETKGKEEEGSKEKDGEAKEPEGPVDPPKKDEPSNVPSAEKGTKCSKGMSFADCELLLMRAAKEQLEVEELMKAAQDPEVSRIMSIIEDFLRTNETMGYGGTAINNILPKELQFYDRTLDVPDYDFFAKDAQRMAIKIADVYAAKGYKEVEAKSGIHHGTYKVFVSFIPVADITDIPPHVFDNLYKESIVVDGIRYVPPSYLRMGMYVELSRPRGDVSRWEKVLDRLNRLNQHFPLTAGDIDCAVEPLQQPLDDPELEARKGELVDILRDTFVRQGAVFFGGFASSIYAEHMPVRVRNQLSAPQPDFDVLVVGAEARAEEVVVELRRAGFRDAKVVAHDAVGELVPNHFEICIGDSDTVAVLFEPIACHSYNTVEYKPTSQKINVATIDTMLSFYLAFIYCGDELNERRMPCMSKFLYDVEQRNRMEDTGELKRFSMKCIGHQSTLAEMRALRAQKRSELKRGDKEWNEWFLDYRPNKPNNAIKDKEDAPKEAPHKEDTTRAMRNPLSKVMSYFRELRA